MKAVVLDGCTLNPGDLSWGELAGLCDLTVHGRTLRDETVARSAGAGALLTNKTVLDRPVLEQLPDLRYVGVLATGYNVVDVDCARSRGVTVTNVPAYGTMSVAQTVFAHLLEHTHRAGAHTESVRRGDWSASPDFCYWLAPLVELDGLTMGIVGFGRIGRAVAAIARAFGMRVLACDAAPPRDLPAGVETADLDRLFAESDAVTLHCPLTAETRHLVDARRLATMKRSAILINASRGPVVDEEALADALERGVIAGAGLDVMETEPPAPGNRLLRARNLTVTPHIAWATRAARSRLMRTATENLRAFLSGSPANVVS